MSPKKKGGLGRGLDSLIPAAQTTTEYLVEQGAQEQQLEISRIKPNKDQPRKEFDREKLRELSLSIKEHGVISPLLVVKKGDVYEIVAGERRYRAAVMAGLKEVPVLIKDFTQKEILEVSLIENVQRENLNALEEAMGYERLRTEFALTQDEIAQRVGKSRVAIANALRLLQLPDDVLSLLREGKLSAGQARAVLSLEEKDKQSAFARHIVDNALSVRACEAQAKTFGREVSAKAPAKPKTAGADSDVRLVEEALSETYSVKAKIMPAGEGRGRLVIEYYTTQALNAILARLQND